MEEIETTGKETINTSKKVSINGTVNRYQMRKLLNKKQIHNRKLQERIDLTKYTHETQIQILSTLKNDNKANEINEDCLLFTKEIKNKITNYKQQDLLKKVFLEDTFVTLDYVIKLLDKTELMCHYCSRKVYIVYGIVREQMQWTLDRIDNDKGHDIDNVVISCLQCNLKRRRTSKDAFMFTKKLNIIKHNFIEILEDSK
uniref:HNH domain-containing protein n=1 Tax=viral metagenome TaxID=1070528 RepID=A0A6C0E2N7_9ZZZZ